MCHGVIFFFKQKTSYEMRISDWSSDVCSSDLFAPKLASTTDGLDFVMKSIERAGYKPGEEVVLALDCASTEFFKNGRYEMTGEGRTLTSAEMAEYIAELCDRYPIMSTEDGTAEEDFEGWMLLIARMGSKVQLVGDDLLVTNPARLPRSEERRVGE